MSETKYTNNEIVSYIVSTKIKAAIYQSIIETEAESEKLPDFCSLDELATAVANDTVRFLVNSGLIEIKETANNDTNT